MNFPVFSVFDKFSRNVLDDLPRHCQIMLLRSHGFVLCLVEEKKVTGDFFFVKSEKFYGIAVEKSLKNRRIKLKTGDEML